MENKRQTDKQIDNRENKQTGRQINKWIIWRINRQIDR